jgi:hypothetical protein
MRRLVLYPTPELPSNTPVQEIRLPWSLRRTLHGAGLVTAGDVRAATDETLLGLKLNSGTVNFIRAALG